MFKNDEIINRALTHCSYSTDNYERLEFLGDSILDFIVAKYFYNNTSLQEGTLTKLRAHYVSENNLCLVFDKLNLEKYVKIGKSCKCLTKSMKCDMIEAVVAGIYLDGGLDVCENFILNNIFIEPVSQIQLLDSKSQLQEWAQSKKLKVEYILLEQKGLSHNPTFVVQAKVGKYEAISQSGNKQLAEQLSARKILDDIENQEK